MRNEQVVMVVGTVDKGRGPKGVDRCACGTGIRLGKVKRKR
jgi:hypothetical protein